MAILPLNIETRACAQVHLHRLRVRDCSHGFSIARPHCKLSSGQKLVKPPEPSNSSQLAHSIPNIFLENWRVYPVQPVILVLDRVGRTFVSANREPTADNCCRLSEIAEHELSRLEGIFYRVSRQALPVFIDLQGKCGPSRWVSPSLSPLKGIFCVGISKACPLFS